MRELTIVSGKGGTGKTTVSAAFAALAGPMILTDCDVDAANLHLLLSAQTRHSEDFRAMRTPRIDPDQCAGCGACRTACRFDAIELDFDAGYLIDPLACEHCGLCALVCPAGAITMEDQVCGQWLVSDTPHGTLVHARLGIGEDNSGKLVTQVRREARRLAQAEGAEWILNDGPPGIGCPVTAAIAGVDLVLAVTEPTPSGLHDLQRVAELCAHFAIPVLACLNKYDLAPKNSRHIRSWCAGKGIEIAGEIPFDPAVGRALVSRRSVVEADCGAVSVAVARLWEGVRQRWEPG